LRRASPEDAPAAALVAASTFLETFAGLLPGPDIVLHVARKSSAEQFQAWAADPSSRVTLAELERGAAPIGYSVLTAPDLPLQTGSEDVELRRIYTMSRFHGQGLGPELMARAAEDARTLGKKRLWLGVFAGNARARTFYEKQGFRLAGERRFLVGSNWFDDVMYARDL
jgi:diamine N-acetyltransferase